MAVMAPGMVTSPRTASHPALVQSEKVPVESHSYATTCTSKTDGKRAAADPRTLISCDDTAVCAEMGRRSRRSGTLPRSAAWAGVSRRLAPCAARAYSAPPRSTRAIGVHSVTAIWTLAGSAVVTFTDSTQGRDRTRVATASPFRMKMLCDTSAAFTTWAVSSSRVPVTWTEVTLKIGAQSAPAITASSTASTRSASSGRRSARS